MGLKQRLERLEVQAGLHKAMDEPAFLVLVDDGQGVRRDGPALIAPSLEDVPPWLRHLKVYLFNPREPLQVDVVFHDAEWRETGREQWQQPGRGV